MTDRELLEMAGKAIQVPAKVIGAEPGLYFLYKCVDGIDGAFPAWNPLKDDGDALRLAVNLPGLDLQYVVASAWQAQATEAGRQGYVRNYIVRVAAEIGKGML